MQELAPHFISVTASNNKYNIKETTVALANYIQNELSIPTIAHLPAVYLSKEKVADTLHELDEVGVHRILALRGDIIPGVEPLKDFRYATDLIEFIKTEAPHFEVIGACYPEGHPDSPNQISDIQNLKKKVDAGCSSSVSYTHLSLAFQPYFTSTASNIGYTWWSHDIGGHMRGYYDEDLALRWLQFGVFSPINRLHSSCNVFNSKEPWFYSPETCRLMKQYLRLRHGLLPYLYTMNVATHEEGLPLVQPLYYHYPNEEEAYEAKNQYFFGSELMVAPITEALDPVFHSASVSVWFPDGVWYDFFHDWKYEGRGKLTVFRTSQDIPVFARPGAIIPMGAQPQTGVNLPEMLDWHLFPGDNRSFVLVEGEGASKVETRLTVDWDERKIRLDLTGDLALLPEKRQHRFLLHTFETDPILVDNQSQEIAMGELQSCPIAKEDRMYELLKSANLAYDRKNELFVACSRAKDWKQLMKVITPLEEGLRQRLFEVIYSSEEGEDL